MIKVKKYIILSYVYRKYLLPRPSFLLCGLKYYIQCRCHYCNMSDSSCVYSRRNDYTVVTNACPFMFIYFMHSFSVIILSNIVKSGQGERLRHAMQQSLLGRQRWNLSTERGLTLQGMSFGLETDADDFFITHKLMTINERKVKLAVLQFKQMDFEAHNLRLSWMCRLRAILVIK